MNPGFILYEFSESPSYFKIWKIIHFVTDYFSENWYLPEYVWRVTLFRRWSDMHFHYSLNVSPPPHQPHLCLPSFPYLSSNWWVFVYFIRTSLNVIILKITSFKSRKLYIYSRSERAEIFKPGPTPPRTKNIVTQYNK